MIHWCADGRSPYGGPLMSRSRRAAVVSVAVLAALIAVGCDNGDPIAAAPTEARPTVSPPPSRTLPVYDASGVDLCTKTDLAPIADLSLTVETRRPDHPLGAPGAFCGFIMHNRADHPALLIIHVSTPETDEEARQTFDVALRGMYVDGPVTGLGMEAEGRLAWKVFRDFTQAEYKISAIDHNLVIEVVLSLGERGYHSYPDLKRRTIAFVKSKKTLVRRRTTNR
jgi:hypothetical protein